MQLTIPDATDLTVRALMRAGMSIENARITAEHLVDAALCGHEFSSLPGVMEDVTDIILNIKSLVVKMDADEPKEMRLVAKKSGAITAGNGLEAVIVAHYTRPSVVIMDVAMPVLDGVQAARLLKASDVTHRINVIAYTAKMNLEDVAVNRLFVDVLRKPASPEQMVGLVQRFAMPAEPEAA